MLLFLVLLLAGSSRQECDLSDGTVEEIESHRATVERIIEAVTNGSYRGEAYRLVAEWTDTFGSRLIGTENLEEAIGSVMGTMERYGLENVHGENASVPHWERNVEECEMIEPRRANVPVLAFGNSTSTPEGGIEAEVVVVDSFSDLIDNYNYSVAGKIVVYNYKYTDYRIQVNYREQGAYHAAQYGAVAALVRSVTPFSLRTLHTGMTHYRSNVTNVPTAAITAEDAHMFQRLQDRGQKIVLRLNIQTTLYPDGTSRNVVGEVPGTESPEKVVVVSGHSDSWDVGQGVMDDAAGAFVSWYSAAVLADLGLRPKRTVRAIVWTSEENRLAGAKQYFQDHYDEMDDFMLMIESDEGTFAPLGLNYAGGGNGACVLREILKLMAPIGTTELNVVDSIPADIELWTDLVPCSSLYNRNERYFWFHHTEADTLDVEDPDNLDKAVALFASVSYVVANLQQDFPRD